MKPNKEDTRIFKGEMKITRGYRLRYSEDEATENLMEEENHFF